MKRQNVRRGILLVSFLLLPATFFYFSPFLVLQGASEGVIAGSAITFIVLFVGSFFVGRAFCGWVMPCGGMQEACFPANDRRVRGGRLNLIKFVIWVPWLAAIAFLFIRAGGVQKVDPLYRTWHGISISEPWMFGIYYGIATIFLVMSFAVGRRAMCHYLCWMAPFMIVGRKLRNALRIPALQLAPTGAQCVHCKLCTKACPMSLDVEQMIAAGRLENSECILCGSCVDICPEKALRLGRGGPQGRG
jgi:ferredoxin-type protein NapH